ncbi:BLOC-1 related complex subunit 6 isoform X1 [Tachypleus tridentatus]|uniref:BLOC-1 related complex subunit 6 isoform X1 n=1 Tax=Tachypleus tridentatus TaxID=6853 RepID=UPI003FD2E6B3
MACNSEETLQNQNTNVLNPRKQTANSLTSSPSNVKAAFSSPLDRQINDYLDQEDNEEFPEVMTGSYGEISFDQELTCDTTKIVAGLDHDTSVSDTGKEDFVTKDQHVSKSNFAETRSRPTSLILESTQLPVLHMENADVYENKHTGDEDQEYDRVNRSQQTSEALILSFEDSPSISSEEFVSSCGHRRTGSDTSGLSELQGMLTFDGDMVSFVADDLQEKIRLSSPNSRRGSRSSTPSLYRQALTPQVPLLDPGALADLEIQAQKVASCLDNMLENLSGTLHSISSLTVDCMENYEKAVCKTCDAVDSNTKAMYQLMAKCEELSNSMKPVYKMSEEIKEIKRVIDCFENIIERKS